MTYGGYPLSLAQQMTPYLQQPQQYPLGIGKGSHPFLQQSQSYGLPQVLQVVAQQLAHLNQQNQQLSQLVQQLVHAVPHQLQQIQQSLQFLPQLIHQQSQFPQQPTGFGGFGAVQQPFGGPSVWSAGAVPQQTATPGQAPGANFGFPALGGQPGPVM